MHIMHLYLDFYEIIIYWNHEYIFNVSSHFFLFVNNYLFALSYRITNIPILYK